MNTLGLKRYTVRLVPYQKEWEEEFLITKATLEDAIGDLILGIEHVGSTAIKHISAKPIIDIAIAIESSKVIPGIVSILEKMDWEYRGDSREDGGHLFVKCCAPDVRTHHLHFVDKEDSQWRNYLFFRDKLNSDNTLAKAYSDLKKGLAKQFKDDRRSYTKAKNDFIASILKGQKK